MLRSGRYPIAQRVGVGRYQIANLEPSARVLVCLRHAIDFIFGEIVPRVEASDGDEGPISAFEMLEDNIP